MEPCSKHCEGWILFQIMDIFFDVCKLLVRIPDSYQF